MKIKGALLVGLLSVVLSESFALSSPSLKLASRPLRLELASSYQQSSDPLTTDLLGKLDPQVKNPHLARWALARKTELKGLSVVRHSDGVYGLTAQAVSSQSQGYVRPVGPWFQPLKNFPCTSESTEWFATQEGATLAAAHAAELWSHSLSEEIHSLSTMLSQVKVQSPETAQTRGEMIFQVWLSQLEKRWRSHGVRESKKSEWSFYSKLAKDEGVCPRSSEMSHIKILAPKSLMEPLSGSPPQWNQILARAPARLWNGLFSVRLNVTVSGRKLNGRFLIDSTAPRSVISPVWLESQGIYPSWILIPDAQPERVSWSGLWNEQMPLSRLVQVEQVELSGLQLPLQQFLLAETEFFSPPENLGSCCDGVLGVDFLRLYPIEFQSQAPSEMRVWPRDKFLWSADTPWAELSETEDGSLVSRCELHFGAQPEGITSSSLPSSTQERPYPSKHLEKILGVRWDTGIEHALQIHTPWQSQYRAKSQGEGAQIQCDSLVLAEGLEPQLPNPPPGFSPLGLLAEKYPAANLGMSLLGQSRFTLDLPHGRIWFDQKSLPLKPMKKNQSGLILKFLKENGERQLRVEQLKSHSLASSLSKNGLRVGATLLEINATSVDELDLWEVDRILSGAHGNFIKLKWQFKKQIKEGRLDLSKVHNG